MMIMNLFAGFYLRWAGMIGVADPEKFEDGEYQSNRGRS